MTDREHRLILRVLSVAEDLVRHSGENPAVVLSEYQQRLAGPMPLDNARRKGWAAGEALTEYLRSDVRLEATAIHWPLDDGDGRLIDPTVARLNLPEGAVLVRVGENDLESELDSFKRDSEFNR